MANKIFRGDAPPIADVYTLTVGGTVEIGDIFNGIINAKTVAYAATATSTTTTATGFAAGMEASVIAEFVEVTWTSASAVVTATGPTDGTPVVITASTTEAGGGAADAQTFVVAHPTVAQGPNDWSVAANWSASGVPSGDSVYLQSGNIDIKYGLDQSAISLTAIHQLASYTGTIGLPDTTTSSGGSYYEYRQTYLTFNDVTTLNVGFGDGSGSSRMKYNTGANAGCTINVYRTSSRKEIGIPALLWKGVHANNVMNVFRGDVGIAFLPGEVATLPVLNILFTSNPSGDSQVWCGAGATLTTITKSAGVLTVNSAVTTLTQNGGDGNFGNGGVTSMFGTGACTTLTVDKGTVAWHSSGTITTLKIGAGGIFDCSAGKLAFTVTNATMEPGAKLIDPKARITHTNAIAVNGPLSSVTIDKGARVNVQFS